MRVVRSLLLARLAERDRCSPTFRKVSLRKGGTLSFLSRRSALESSRFSLYLSFFCTQRSLLLSSDFCVLMRIFLSAFNCTKVNKGECHAQSFSARPISYGNKCFNCSTSLSKTSSEKADPAYPSAEAESSLARASVTAVCFP